MRALSAAEAITPAIARTRQVLFGHRSWSTFLKIAGVAVLAGVGNGLNLNLGGSHNNNGHIPHMTPQMGAALAAIMAFALLAVLVALAIGLLLFYVGCRMQFVLFDIVLTLRTEVAPAWRKYGSRTWRWIGLKFCLVLSLLVVLALIAMPVILRFLQERHNPNFSPVDLLGTIIASAFMLFAVLFVFFIFATLIYDFVLPAVALEDTPVLSAIGRLLTLCKAEPGQIALYLLLHIVIALVVGTATVFAFVVAILVAGMILGLIGLVLFAVLHHHGAGATAVMVLGFIALGAIFLAWLLAVYVAVVGTVVTFRQAWALYFLGGRYTLLGDLLEPPVVYAAPAAIYPPASPFVQEPPPLPL